MEYRQCIYPDPPTPILILDGMVEQTLEQLVAQVSDLFLLLRARVDVGESDQELLPHGHLKDGASILATVLAQGDQVEQELLLDLEDLVFALGLGLEECGNHLQRYVIAISN